jgi:uncharacterized protein YecE (DUF72 family)
MIDEGKHKNTDEVSIGMGGWELPPFQHVFYPAKREKGFRKLEYFSRFFDLVEVNSTFYNASLSPSQAHQWLDDVHANKKFTFTAKLYRGFTHTWNATKNDARAVHRLLDPLRNAETFGGLVIQFPFSFNKTRERQAYLVKLRTLFPEDHLFLDLRHSSWNEYVSIQFFQEHGFHLINIDLPDLPGYMPLNSFAWDGIAYFRMMGRNADAWKQPGSANRYLYRYSNEELQELVQKIKQTGARKTYVVFHNDAQAFSLLNGRQVEHAIHPVKRLNAPANLLVTFPQLKSFCDPPVSHSDLFLNSSS